MNRAWERLERHCGTCDRSSPPAARGRGRRLLAARGLPAIVWLGLLASAVLGREWTDRTGKFRVEATPIAVKKGKVYLEKADGSVTAVDLEKLSQADVNYLRTLPDFSEYFGTTPAAPAPAAPASPTPSPAATATTPGPASARPAATVSVTPAPPPMAATTPSALTIPGVDENKVGEVCRLGDLGWGVECLAFSPNGLLLAAGKMDRAVLVYDITRQARTASVEKLEQLGQVTCLAFSPDGTKLLTGGYSGRIQIWEVGADGSLTEGNRFVGHIKAVRAMAISRNGKLVLSGGDEQKARCWELDTGRELFAIEGFRGAVKEVYLTRGAKQGLASDGETLALIDVQQGQTIQAMKLKNYSTQVVAVAPDGSRVVVQDLYALLQCEIRSGRPYPPLQGNDLQWSARFLPNSKYLLAGGNQKVSLWELATQRKVYEFDMADLGYVKALACSPDNRHFAAIPSGAGQAIQVFRLPSQVTQ